MVSSNKTELRPNLNHINWTVTSLAGGEVSNNSIISDVCLDLVFDEQDDELALLLDPWILPLHGHLSVVFRLYVYGN